VNRCVGLTSRPLACAPIEEAACDHVDCVRHLIAGLIMPPNTQKARKSTTEPFQHWIHMTQRPSLTKFILAIGYAARSLPSLPRATTPALWFLHSGRAIS
jgi:hypothetical protein